MTLPLTGPTLVGYNNLPAIPPEAPLGDLLNELAASSGGSLGERVSANTVLGVVALNVTLPVGQYKFDLLVMSEIVGGGGGDGLLIESDFSGGLVQALTNFSVFAVEGTSAAQFIAPSNSIGFGFTGAPTSMIRIEGFIDVTTAGSFGFRCGKQGTPTSVTLMSGSGLLVTPLV